MLINSKFPSRIYVNLLIMDKQCTLQFSPAEATQFAKPQRLFGREIINPFKIKVAPLIKKNGKKRKTIFLGTEKRLSFVIVQSYLESDRSSQNDHSNNKLGSNLLSRVWRLKKVQKKITCILAAFYRVKYIASTKVSWEVFEQASINFDLGLTLSFGNTSIQMAPKTPIYDASAIICKTNVTLLVRNRSFIEPVNSKKVETFCKPIESTAYCFNRKCK